MTLQSKGNPRCSEEVFTHNKLVHRIRRVEKIMIVFSSLTNQSKRINLHNLNTPFTRETDSNSNKMVDGKVKKD